MHACLCTSLQNTGASRGFGFVEFSTETAMSQAITEMNQLYIDGSMLTVRAADDGPPTMHNNAAGGGRRGGAERKPTRRQNEPNKLFVGGLPYDVDNESLVRTRKIHQYCATSPGASVLELWSVSLVCLCWGGWITGSCIRRLRRAVFGDGCTGRRRPISWFWLRGTAMSACTPHSSALPSSLCGTDGSIRIC